MCKINSEFFILCENFCVDFVKEASFLLVFLKTHAKSNFFFLHMRKMHFVLKKFGKLLLDFFYLLMTLSAIPYLNTLFPDQNTCKSGFLNDQIKIRENF